MVSARRLDAQEKEAYTRTKVPSSSVLAKIREEYDDLFAEFNEGDIGEVTLQAEDKESVVKQRIKSAARRRKLRILFRKVSNTLFLEVKSYDWNVRKKRNAPSLTAPPPEEPIDTTAPPPSPPSDGFIEYALSDISPQPPQLPDVPFATPAPPDKKKLSRPKKKKVVDSPADT